MVEIVYSFFKKINQFVLSLKGGVVSLLLAEDGRSRYCFLAAVILSGKLLLGSWWRGGFGIVHTSVLPDCPYFSSSRVRGIVAARMRWLWPEGLRISVLVPSVAALVFGSGSHETPVTSWGS